MAVRGGDGDPRTVQPTTANEDVRPIVALPRRGLPAWMLLAFMFIAGVLLFSILDSRRRAAMAPAVQPRAGEMVAIPAPPPLIVPPEPRAALPLPAPQPAPAPAPAPAPQIVYVPQPMPNPPYVEPAPPPRVISADPALVLDAGASPAPQPTADPEAAGETPSPLATTSISGTRARAGALANRSTTVPQGTLVPAVLETALDLTRPGLARAIVSRDVRGFDGSRVLIPRGSRLIGEYRSEVQPGQRRALVNWLRLIRPDGVTIAIGSPSGDPLGRGGIGARVDTHFFARFGEAILQTALDIGVNLATAAALDDDGGDDTVIVVPGTVRSGASQVIPPRQITPTLTVRQGTSISIFVARDLDFTGAEPPR